MSVSSNPRARPLLFLSHIHEEADLARFLKDQIETLFLGAIDVFVSSSPTSIGPGQRWLEQISRALSQAEAYVLLCSPPAVNRPWIFFEAGAGWARDKLVVPLCHSGMRPSALPTPLNSLQAIDINNPSDLDSFVGSLAQILGLRKPGTDFTLFLQSVSEWQELYTFWSQLNYSLEKIGNQHAEDWKDFLSNQTANFLVRESSLEDARPSIIWLTKNQIINFTEGGMLMGDDGIFKNFSVTAGNRVSALFDPRCVLSSDLTKLRDRGGAPA